MKTANQKGRTCNENYGCRLRRRAHRPCRLSSHTEFLASPVGTIEEKSFAKVAEKIVYATREFDVGMVVIGLPKNMDGTEGARAEKSRKLADTLRAILPIPVELWDERQTTIAAANILSENGTYGKKRKKVLDSVAATVILESYLAFRKNSGKHD